MQHQLSLTNTVIIILLYFSTRKKDVEFFWFILVLMLLCSCSKRSVDLEALKHETRISSSLDSSSAVKLRVSTEKRTIHIRMEQSGYQVLIKPKGIFKFSQDKGFEGEAESISISGQTTKADTFKEDLKQDLDSSRKASFSKKADSLQKNSSKAKHTDASGLSWWVYPAIILAAIVIWFITPFSKIRTWLSSNLKSKNPEG